MSHGIPVIAPWLTAIHARLLEFFNRGESLVVACSALEQQYREVLADGVPITWVYLKGSKELIRSRMKHRRRHFMKANMLDSQFEALEEPFDALFVDISLPSSAIVSQILARLRQPPPALQNDAAPRNLEEKRFVG